MHCRMEYSVAYLLLHCLYKMCVNHGFDHLIFFSIYIENLSDSM